LNLDYLLKLPYNNIEMIIRKFIAINKIQKVFKEVYYNPEYKICKNRLHREFNNMFNNLMCV